MHRIIQSYVKTFCEENGISKQAKEDKQFEYVANYCIIRSFYPEDFDPELITTDDADDAGIDGICFLIDGELVTTFNEAQDIFNRPKRNISVTIYLMQAKTSESFDKGEILKFGQGTVDLVTEHSELPQSDFIKDQKEILNLIIDNVPKLLNGRPDVCLRYITNSNNPIAAEIEATRKTIIRDIENTGFFNSVEFCYIGLNDLIKLWDKSQNSINALFEVRQSSPYPSMPGVTEAYIAIVPLREYVDKVLSDSDGRLRLHIFEENVRAFLGESNPVNKQIQETLKVLEKQERFAILNNGITIIAPEVKIQNEKISIDNYRIVNGCQTSNVLFENRDLIKANAMITVRVIEATDLDVIADVVRATNSQSKVEEAQFISYESIVRRIERYFLVTEDKPGEEVKLYFERRIGQYRNTSTPKVRIFSITDTCRAVGAMFLQVPDMAFRYPTKMITNYYDKLLNDKNKEIVYYTAALALYRWKLLTAHGKIDSKYTIHKWHILSILPYAAWNKTMPSMANKKIEAFCKNIIGTCSKSDDECLALFKKATDVIDALGGQKTRDEIRSQAYTQSILKYCNEHFRQTV